ncbi:MAG: DUF6461 domain-containing protein [Nocardioidaceae bacterium]
MTASTDYYERVSRAFPDTESVTVLFVRGMSRTQVAADLRADLAVRVEDPWGNGESQTGWAIHEIPGGVLAIEQTGYGDPSLEALGALSKGGAAAVVRSNVQAHVRFGCARDGAVLFDDNEYMYVEDPAAVPQELRSLFDLVWDDLEDDDLDDEGPDGFVVGLAMAGLVTGVEISGGDVEAAIESGFFAAPALVYGETPRG